MIDTAADVRPCDVTLCRVWAIFWLGLFAATWRLWTPQNVFPQIPVIGWAGAIPRAWEWVGAAAIPLTLFVAVITPPRSRWRVAVLWVFALVTATMVAIDQQRLQPWVYQGLIVSIVLVAAAGDRGARLLRLLTISIYAYSAVSRLDYTFLHTLGPQFLAVLLHPLGVAPEAWPPAVRVGSALVFPIAELLIAAGLCWRPARHIALWGATVLHLLLLIVLGPLGLNQKPAVLIWNLYFIVQNWLLFAAAPLDAVGSVSHRKPTHWIAEGLVGMALVWPLFEPLAWCDHWLAWGLYSPRGSRVTILIRSTDLDRLPDELRQYAIETTDTDTWLEFRFDRWALDVLATPVYPQARTQLGIAEAIARRYGLDGSIRAVRSSAAARLTGERHRETLESLPAIVAAGGMYLINNHPPADPKQPNHVP